MDEIEFWALIDDARQGADDDLDVIVGRLIDLLDDLSDEALVGFHHQVIRRYVECFRWDLRAATVIICGDETTEETIDGFVGWLIAQGQTRFEAALANPDSLADVDFLPEDALASEILTLANQEYQQRNGGQEIPDEPGFSLPDEPAGKPLEASELPRRFPKLCDQFEFEASS